MNVVDASHLNVIKRHLELNPDVEFKMRKFEGTWTLGMVNMFDPESFVVVNESSFAQAVKVMSGFLSNYDREQEDGGCRRS
jgi:hypothetical protein